MRMAGTALALIAALAGPGLAQEARKPVAAVKLGDKVPDFTVVDLAGKTLRFSDLQKKSKTGVVSLTFWCTICSSCRAMEARLEKLHEANRDNASIYALDANAGGETPAQIVAFNKQKNLTFPVVLDAKGAVANLFGVGATTTTLIIDKEGVLRYRGRFDDPKAKASYAEEAVKSLVAGDPVAIKQTAPVG